MQRDKACIEDVFVSMRATEIIPPLIAKMEAILASLPDPT
jgi:hypothetical protein